MGAYVPNPQDPTQPTTAQLAGNMAYELQALKGYIQSLVSSGTNFAYIGSFRNRLNNGSFRVQQRGNSVTVPNGIIAYTLDQWIVYSAGDSTVVTGGTGGVASNNNFLQLVPGAANTLVQLFQRIESANCQDLVAGTSVTISGFFSGSSLTGSIPTITLLTPTAVDNWASTTTVGAFTPMVISAQAVNTLQFFSQTFVLSADATAGLEVVFNWGGAAGLTLQLASMQLEKGAQYTQFEYRPIEVEFRLCQRYYQSQHWYSSSTAAAASAQAGNSTGLGTTMRTTPTVIRSGVVTTNCSFGGAPGVGPNYLSDVITSAASSYYSAYYTALLSAEL